MTDNAEKQLALTVTNEQRDVARRILGYVAAEIDRVAAGDQKVVFAMRRYVHSRIQLKNRPPKGFQKKLFDLQRGICPYDSLPFTELTGAHVHRIGPGGYTIKNCQLLHKDCHEKFHLEHGGEADED